MVSGFRRSLSLSIPKSHPSAEKSYHIRSTSLPSRSHPLISHIQSHILALRSFQIRPEIHHATLDWVSSGLRRIESLHSSLDDLLRLPQSNAVILRHSPAWIDRALEHFLLFADAYDNFRSAVIAVKHHAALAEVAVRRRDDSGMNSVLRDQKKIERKLIKMATMLRDAGRITAAAESEVAGVIGEVTAVTMTVTAALFSAVNAVLTEVFAAVTGPSTAAWVVRRVAGKKGTAKAGEEEKLGRLEDLEARVEGLEGDCERVFRCFVNIRVTLLNTISPFS